MKVVADAVREYGGRLVRISVGLLCQWAKEDADEMVFAADLAEWKALLARADAVVVQPGPGNAGRGVRGPGAEEARTGRQAGGPAEHARTAPGAVASPATGDASARERGLA